MSERTHFVYRAYDALDQLLYIGCSKNLEQRRKQHRADGARWLAYAERFKVSGPYPRRRAFDLEREAIATEEPWFNATRPELLPLRVANWAARARIRQELTDVGAALPEPGFDASKAEWDAFIAQAEAIGDRAQAVAPYPNPDWIEEQYLNARRLRAVRSA